jgi:rSAM/selenodomain-associated transferase 2
MHGAAPDRPHPAPPVKGEMTLAIVVPVLDEIAVLPGVLNELAPLRAAGAEIIVVDGGSSDGSEEYARQWGAVTRSAPRGRASQMNAGAASTSADALVFLHADTRLPVGADRTLRDALARRSWGRFDVRIEGRAALLGVIARLINFRSRLTGIATGDQAIFVRRAAFEAIGGFPDQPLMEDVELSIRLRRQFGRPACPPGFAVTSGRRWERRGVLRTVWLMLRLRFAYWRGSPPDELAELYQ